MMTRRSDALDYDAFEVDDRVSVRLSRRLAHDLAELILDSRCDDRCLLALGHILRTASGIRKDRNERNTN